MRETTREENLATILENAERLVMEADAGMDLIIQKAKSDKHKLIEGMAYCQDVLGKCMEFREAKTHEEMGLIVQHIFKHPGKAMAFLAIGSQIMTARFAKALVELAKSQDEK